MHNDDHIDKRTGDKIIFEVITFCNMTISAVGAVDEIRLILWLEYERGGIWQYFFSFKYWKNKLKYHVAVDQNLADKSNNKEYFLKNLIFSFVSWYEITAQSSICAYIPGDHKLEKKFLLPHILHVFKRKEN